MPRKRTGSIEERNGRLYIKLTVTLENGSKARRKVELPEGTTRQQAERRRVALVTKASTQVFEARESIASAPQSSLTFDKYVADLWLPARTRRGLRSVRKDRERLEKHVSPVIGQVPMEAITEERLRDVVAELDRKMHDESVKFGWKTAHKVWGTATKLFKDATRSKDSRLRVLAQNPCYAVEGPDRGNDKAKQWLYPSEFEQLISCAAVPLRWRRIYAIATYSLARVSEVRAMTWEHTIDLDRGMLRIDRSTDERGRTVRETTKEGDVRHCRIEPALLPLLRAMKGREGKGLLLESIDDPAGELKRHLRKAGVMRPELFASTQSSIPIRFHDLRATGITWSAMRGDLPIEIRDRAGHADLEQTNEYIRRASLVGNVGVPFPELSVLYTEDKSSPFPPEIPFESSPGIVPAIPSYADLPTMMLISGVRRGGLEVPGAGSTAIKNALISPGSSQTTARGDGGDDSRGRFNVPPARLGPTVTTTPKLWSLALAAESVGLRQREGRVIIVPALSVRRRPRKKVG